MVRQRVHQTVQNDQQQVVEASTPIAENRGAFFSDQGGGQKNDTPPSIPHPPLVEGSPRNFDLSHSDKIDVSKLSPREQEVLRRRFPSRFHVPNIAQARCARNWKVPPYKRVQVVTFGNGTGKTDFLSEVLCGVMKGPLWVNPEWYDWQFFRDLERKRRNGTLTVWWVCDAEYMKEGAADYKAIKAHIPDARFRGKTNNGVYREIHIPVVGEGGKPINIVVHVKTHDQDTTSFAAETVDVIIADEPIPEQHWSEIVGRWRTKEGDVGCRVIIGATPLELSEYIYVYITDPETAIYCDHVEGSLWENCIGRELPDEEGIRLGVPKNSKGEWETRGVLTRESIEAQIAAWKKDKDPAQLPARIDGKFAHLEGHVYKNFSQRVHVIDDYAEIPKTFPIIQIVDPHDSRPDCSGWYMITPSDKIVCIMEYPTKPYESIVTRNETIVETCETWRRMENERGIAGQVVARYGDPNKLLDPDAWTGKTKIELYKACGFTFSVAVNDNIAYGHEQCRKLLYYDQSKFEEYPHDPMFQPTALFCRSCRNHQKYIANYGVKRNKTGQNLQETPEEAWKDFADLFRYMAVVFKPFSHWRARYEVSGGKINQKANNEWESIRAAREGGTYVPEDQFGGKMYGRDVEHARVYA